MRALPRHRSKTLDSRMKERNEDQEGGRQLDRGEDEHEVREGKARPKSREKRIGTSWDSDGRRETILPAASSSNAFRPGFLLGARPRWQAGTT
eukprot:8372571-Pyramimonas_sp.AAC.1